MSIAAFFDFDGTLADTDIKDCYFYFVNQTAPFSERLRRWWNFYIKDGPKLLQLERSQKRKAMNELLYSHYAGLPAEQTKALASKCYVSLIFLNSFPEGFEKVVEHLKRGEEPVIVTGSLDFIIKPIAEELGINHTICAALEEQDGYFTGRLIGEPIGEEVKAEKIRQFAAEHSIDLAASYAYGDSRADLPMLEAVGNPRVVNPGKKLKKITQERRWPVYQWKTARASCYS